MHEVLIFSDRIERAITVGYKAVDIEDIPIEEGTMTMRNDGFVKASQGITTIDEVIRITSE